MSVFAIFCWFALVLCIAAAAWGVGYDQGSTERERLRRLGYLPPPERFVNRDVYAEYKKTGDINGRILQFRGRQRV